MRDTRRDTVAIRRFDDQNTPSINSRYTRFSYAAIRAVVLSRAYRVSRSDPLAWGSFTLDYALRPEHPGVISAAPWADFSRFAIELSIRSSRFRGAQNRHCMANLNVHAFVHALSSGSSRSVAIQCVKRKSQEYIKKNDFSRKIHYSKGVSQIMRVFSHGVIREGKTRFSLQKTCENTVRTSYFPRRAKNVKIPVSRRKVLKLLSSIK